jgi:putative endopeptidase
MAMAAAIGVGAAPLTASSADSPGAEPTLPSTGAWGFDLAGRDLKTKPGDDFFQWANGTYQDQLVIPADRPSFSPRTASAVLTEFRIRQILEQAAATAEPQPKTVNGKIGAYYASFMDEARIEALGAKPMAADLAQVRAARSRADLARLMGAANETFHSGFFGAYVSLDAKDVDHNVVYLGQAGLGLPDRDYYLDAKFAKEKAAYEAYVARMLGMAGWPDAEAQGKAVLALETRVAEASWTKVDQRDADKTYNAMTPAELAAYAPGFDWGAYFAGAKIADARKVVVAEKTAFPKIAAVFADTPLDTLKAWQAFHLVDNASPYLSKAFADANFEFRGKVLNGQPEQRARWKRAVGVVSGDGAFGGFGSLGFAVGQVYTDKYFPPESKAKVEALVADLKTAFRARIQKLDWMAPETKAAALKKLDTYKIKVGYPDKPRDYSGFVIRRDDLYGNVLRSAAGEWAYNRAKLKGPVDRDEWFMTPQTNNAYNGSLNDIVFPAAILTAPVFNPDADPAINYGAVGGVIGHEFSHGFDDQGRKFDWRGELKDWWTDKDAATFKSRAAVLGAQYSTYEPLPGAKVNGELTMGENIADLGGLTVALDAYRLSLKGRPAPVLDGLTGDQRVFLGWAQAWRGKLRDDALRQLVVSDPHSPRQYRVNGVVRNMDDWYVAFDVKPGDKLYLPPEQRVRIW